jgi:hypothetical protein
MFLLLKRWKVVGQLGLPTKKLLNELYDFSLDMGKILKVISERGIIT